MNKVTVSREKWNKLKESRGVSDEVFLASELDEKILFHKGILRNSGSSKGIFTQNRAVSFGSSFNIRLAEKCIHRFNVLR